MQQPQFLSLNSQAEVRALREPEDTHKLHP